MHLKYEQFVLLFLTASVKNDFQFLFFSLKEKFRGE